LCNPIIITEKNGKCRDIRNPRNIQIDASCGLLVREHRLVPGAAAHLAVDGSAGEDDYETDQEDAEQNLHSPALIAAFVREEGRQNRVPAARLGLNRATLHDDDIRLKATVASGEMAFANGVSAEPAKIGITRGAYERIARSIILPRINYITAGASLIKAAEVLVTDLECSLIGGKQDGTAGGIVPRPTADPAELQIAQATGDLPASCPVLAQENIGTVIARAADDLGVLVQ